MKPAWYPRLMTRSEQIIEEEQDGREETMPKSWKASMRTKARKILKNAGLAEEVIVGNDEGILHGDLEFGIISSRKSNDYIPTIKLYEVFKLTERSGMPIRFETINEYVGVVRLIHVSERNPK